MNHSYHCECEADLACWQGYRVGRCLDTLSRIFSRVVITPESRQLQTVLASTEDMLKLTDQRAPQSLICAWVGLVVVFYF